MLPNQSSTNPLQSVLTTAALEPDGVSDPVPFSDIANQAGITESSNDLSIVGEQSPLDPGAFFAQEKRRILSSYTSEYGHPQEDPDEPRTGTTGFFASLLPEGFGKNTMSDLRNIVNESNPRNAMTDADHLLSDLRALSYKHPKLMDTPEGEAFATDLEKRVEFALDQDPMGAWDLIGQIADYGYNNPGALSEMILDETVYNPLIPLLAWGGYRIGSVAGGAAARALSLTKMLNRLRMGTARQRLAALAATNTMSIAGFGTAEAGINAGYQVSTNKSTGRDAMHNTITVAQLGLALGVTAGMLRGAYRTINGGAGLGKSYEKAATSQGYRNFDHMMDDLAVKSGWQPAKIMQLWKDSLDELPFNEVIDHVMKNKVSDIASAIPPSTPRGPRNVTPPDMDGIYTGMLSTSLEHKSQHSFFGNLFERKGKTDPAGRDAQGNPFYNIQSTVSDIKNGLTWLRGLNSDGTRAKGAGASIRQKIFEGWDAGLLTEWVQRRGAKGYQELLQRIEMNKLKLKGLGESAENMTRKAIHKSFEEMGAPHKIFKKLSTADKLRDGIRATLTQTAKTASEVINNPRLLYKPMKDVFTDTGGFVKELVEGPVGGAKVSTRQREILGNLLRDWEGNKLAGELDLKLFTDWLRREIPSRDKRDAMSHFLEGEEALSRYNARRIKNGQSRVELSTYEKQVASSVRKFFDDTLNWGQKSELFTLFRERPFRYKQAKRQAGDTSVDKRTTIPDEELWDFVNASTDPRGLMWQVSGRKDAMGYYQNYVPHLVQKKFAPTEESLFEWSLDDMHKAGQLQTKSKHLRKRSYETMMDAMDAGEQLYTQDIAQLVGAYGKSMLRSQVNARLLKRLRLMKDGDGHPMLGRKSAVPEYYVPFEHPNFRTSDGQYLYVNPNMAPDLRLYFDTSNPGVANRVLQNIILIAKRAALSLSFFHVAALGWSGLVSGQKPHDLIANVFPTNGHMTSRGLRALSGTNGRDMDYLKIGMRNGLSIGILEELRGDTLINGIRSLADFTERSMNNPVFRPLGKTLSTGLRGVAKSQEIIDSHLWDHVNSGLKATTYLTTMEKMILQDAKRVDSGAQAELSSFDKLAQRAAQFTNDAYGAQNWAQMAMNVENFMGHRIAAAMNKPSMRGYIRMLVFAPDWSLSNMRVIGKFFTGLAPIGKKELAHREYAKYALRSAVLFAFINEVLQVTSGQPSILTESGTDLMYADLGDGKKMQISKQLAEVMSIGIHGPLHVAEGKLSAPIKAYRDADSVGEFAGNMAGSAVPISAGQAAKGNWAGTFGVPLYKDGY